MKRLLTIAFILLSCNRTKEHHYTTAQLDTIRKASFSRLNERDAYELINKYYLPRLDTLGVGRKIFVHPLRSRDILGEYLRKINAPSQKVILIPTDFGTDSTFSWDQSKLNGVHIVSNEELAEVRKYRTKPNGYDSLYDAKWIQKFGPGYICISYPMYNSYTKRAFIYEWIENNAACGTGRDSRFFYTKIGDSWIKY